MSVALLAGVDKLELTIEQLAIVSWKVGGTMCSNIVKQHVHCACRDMSAHLLHVIVFPLLVDCVELHVKTFIYTCTIC